jgi:hypothetical protein
VDVAAAGGPSPRHDCPVTFPDEVGQQLASDKGSGADGHPDGQVRPSATLFATARTRLPVTGGQQPATGERGKVVEVAGRFQDNIAARPTVAAVRSALGLEGLGAKGCRSAAAMARADTNGDEVGEQFGAS